jgi:ubiquitin-conjugating enzyme E2 variant
MEVMTTISVKPHAHDSMPGFRLLQAAAYVLFASLSIVLMIEIVQGAISFGYLWLLPLMAGIAYVAADFVSGFVHFLADNFGSPETPIVGKAFVLPFREHHDDPTAILHKPFFVSNGGNCMVIVPFLAAIVLLVPVDDSFAGYLTGAFGLTFSFAILLTNQFHKWAHMEAPPPVVLWLQERRIILSRDHHDIHHVSPFDTHYCITTGWWNPMLERIRFFEITASLIRKVFPAPGWTYDHRGQRQERG